MASDLVPPQFVLLAWRALPTPSEHRQRMRLVRHGAQLDHVVRHSRWVARRWAGTELPT